MKRILGLDLGVTSIGWAFIQEAQENESFKNEIVSLGSRIIPLSTKENDEFTKGNAQTTNAGRRDKRGARRNLQRYKLRKHYLSETLKNSVLQPSGDLFELTALKLYELRDRAIREKISTEEIGRLFFMLNQKRGYKSNRKANNEEEKESASDKEVDYEKVNNNAGKKGYLELIADREGLIKKHNITIGQYFYRELLNNPHFRIKENIFTRASYIAEFDKIWETQKKFYPQLLTEHLYKKIKSEIIFYQRPLKSQKDLVSECRFEKYHKVAPKSSPLFQICKIWQEINNIEITSFKAIKGTENDNRFATNGKRFLSQEEKIKLFEVLYTTEKLTSRKLLELLGYKTGLDNYSINIQKDFEGNRTGAMLVKTFSKLNIFKPEILENTLTTCLKECIDTITGEISQRLQITSDFEKQPLYQLWHLIYSIDEPTILENALQNKYGFTADQSRALAKLDFHKSGYGNLSARAIRNILPYLQQGLKYSEACEKAGYRHSDFQTLEENAKRELKNKLDLLKKGALRNPAVEKIINHTINLLNSILEDPELGKPDEIRIELARELRQNADERKRTFKNNSEKDREHKLIADVLQKELGFNRVSRNDIERYKLWEEFGRVSPYDPHKAISLSELFGGGYDIEHIIPKSRVFDDSFANKTICPRSLNAGAFGKNQMTAYDFMKSRGESEFGAYVEFVSSFYKDRNKRISKGKFERLMMPAEKIPSDFINRQLNETRYISKEITKILSEVCRNVYTTTGTITSELRHHWGYDDVTMKLNTEKYELIGKTYSYTDKNGNVHNRIQDWSKRDDHRHHAIDALVIACTKQSIIQRMNNLNQMFLSKSQKEPVELLREKQAEMGLDTYIEKLRPFTPPQVENCVSKVLVSFKPGKRVAISSRNPYKHKTGSKIIQTNLIPRGQLSEETIYGKVKLRDYKDVSLDKNFSLCDYIADASIKKIVRSRLAEHDNNPEKAFSKLKENPILDNNHQPITKVKIWFFADEYVVKYKLDGNFNKQDKIIDNKIKELVIKRLEAFNNNPKLAFKNLDENPIWLNKEKGIKIKTVRCATGLSKPQPLHIAKNGKTYPATAKYKTQDLADAKPVDFVNPGNNHHIAIYKNKDGKFVENIVTFWNALSRKKLGIPIIIKNPHSVWDFILSKNSEGAFPVEILENLPNDDWEYITSLQQNEMFILGLHPDNLKLAIDSNDYAIISKHLYRVQKIASVDYFFRHHLETKLIDTAESKEIKRFYRIRNLEIPGIKVTINRLGKIEKIGE